MELGRAAARGRFAGPLTLGAAGRVAGELQEAWRGTTAPARRRPAGSSTVTLVPTSSWLTMTRRPPCSSISALASARSRPALGEGGRGVVRSEEHTSELQSLMRISYAVFCLKKKKESR